MNNKLLPLLGICKKAGKLAEGFDPCAEAVKGGKAYLVITASDLSAKTRKEIVRVCDMSGVEHLETLRTMDEIWSGLGRRSGVLAVLDKGLADNAGNIAAEIAAGRNEED